MKKIALLLLLILPIGLVAQNDQNFEKVFEEFQNSINQTFNAFQDSIHTVFAKVAVIFWL